jgi:hypothetical protein
VRAGSLFFGLFFGQVKAGLAKATDVPINQEKRGKLIKKFAS